MTLTHANPRAGGPIVRDRLYLGGRWVESSGRGTLDVIDSTTEEVMGRIPEGTAQDVDRAVVAARAAFQTWSQTTVEARADALDAIAAGLEERADEIAALVARELGMPISQAILIQAGLPRMSFAAMASLLREQGEHEERIGNALVVREPAGVVGCITPWNYPLHQIAAKVAPALAAGCTVVLKPSEVTPLNAFVLAEIIDAAGLPGGAFNLVTGLGPVVGEAIAANPGVDVVSFTGSTGAGRRVAQVAAGTLKRVALELGGKSANVILDDADLEAAVVNGVGNCFLNSGQTCVALTRMLVPRSRLSEVEAIAAAAADQHALGDPLDPAAQVGPLVSAAQRERVRAYIVKGLEEGARLVAGGPEPPEGLERGYFVRPTVFSDVRSDMTIAQEEIFGPVLSIIPYDDEDDAVRIANDSIYGLSGGVWSSDPERAQRVARRIRTGMVEINGAAFNALAPFGGVKHSGYGRELGRHGLDEFLDVKAIRM
ncbi:MAG TPA: aldehyde dehydrogenase family protein [Solirubrobacteraceae bacterium]|jgi:acyl-CoA reductase-like NAD-dependent aldehyde dehydrogenase